MLVSHEVPLSLLEKSRSFNDYDYALVHLFEIYPEFDLVSDGIRSTDLEFRNICSNYYDYYIDTYGINAVNLSGSIDERFKAAVKIINKRFRNLRNF